MDVLKWLILSFCVATLLPGIICWQAYYIRKLKRRVMELEEEKELSGWSGDI